MKRICTLLATLFLLFTTQATVAGTGLLFNVAATGVPANPSITLCLSGRGPLSCQNYTVSSLSLSIKSTLANHAYPAAGIKVNTPGYTLSGCTPFKNGYCLFSVSNTLPAMIYITPSNAIQYWVATNGSDTASGDINHPFLTIKHARDVIRANPSRRIRPIYVNIKGGNYRFSEPLSLGVGDSGSSQGRVVYRAAIGAHPSISGAEQITGWSLHDAGLNIWVAQGSVSTPTMPRQLYVNGKRATRARTANYPNYYTPTSTGYTFLYTSGAPPLRPNWTNPTAIEAVTVTQWKMMRCPIDHITQYSNDNSDLVMATPCWTNANVYPSPWNFHLLSWFENAYEFLDTPGYWYMDPVSHKIYYIPLAGENITTADVELPILDTLVLGAGDQNTPVSYINFEGISFGFATWYDPSSANGYVCDQSGFHLNGSGHSPNLIGHDQNVVRTPGNVSFSYAQNIIFSNNTFTHLGAAGLDFTTGSQNNQIVNNVFNDISSTGIQLGGVDVVDHHPSVASQFTKDNKISNNLLQYTGREFYDAAAIYIGFTTNSLVEYNDIIHVPWSGIAIGWGWGLLDSSGFPGLPFAVPYEWGFYYSPSAAHRNQIVHNKIQYYLEKLWDGGAIYSTGFQGTSITDGQFIGYNVAQHKRANAGSNTFYTDGGSRYITLTENVSLDNPQGYFDFGPCGLSSSFDTILCSKTNVDHYGADTGGCIPFGDIVFKDNYLRDIVTFYDICFNIFTVGYPVNITASGSKAVTNSSQVPASIINSAGRQY